MATVFLFKLVLPAKLADLLVEALKLATDYLLRGAEVGFSLLRLLAEFGLEMSLLLFYFI